MDWAALGLGALFAFAYYGLRHVMVDGKKCGTCNSLQNNVGTLLMAIIIGGVMHYALAKWILGWFGGE